MSDNTLKITVEHDDKKMIIEVPHTGAWDDDVEIFRTIAIWVGYHQDTVFPKILKTDEPYPDDNDA